MKKLFFGLILTTLVNFVFADVTQNIAELTKKSEAGDASAQRDLGNAYYEGNGVQKSLDESFKWWYKSAQQGNPKAQVDVCMCYLAGEGVQVDPQKALEWANKAAAQNYDGALYQLGAMYMVGDGVKKDDKTALSWFMKAANQGMPKAEYAIYLLYSRQADETNQKTAMVWLRKAAEDGYIRAQIDLGCGADNKEESFKWLEKAADQGDIEAQQILVLKYTVANDPRHAYMWLVIGVGDPSTIKPLDPTQGYDSTNPNTRRLNMKDSLEIMKKGLTPAQIAEGDRLVQEWREKHPAK